MERDVLNKQWEWLQIEGEKLGFSNVGVQARQELMYYEGHKQQDDASGHNTTGWHDTGYNNGNGEEQHWYTGGGGGYQGEMTGTDEGVYDGRAGHGSLNYG